MKKHTGCSLSSKAARSCLSRYSARLLTLLLLLVAAATQARADDFYTYTFAYDTGVKVYKVALTSGFKDQLNKASGGQYTGTSAAGTILTWKTGDPLPAFNANYDDGTNGALPLSLKQLFNGCQDLTSLDLSNYNTANVAIMNSMFGECSSLTSLDLSKFNTENVTDMEGMFSGCTSLTSINLTSFNTANVTTMTRMFADCSNLTSLDLSNFNTASVTSMHRMFVSCMRLSSLKLGNFYTANVTDMRFMFANCFALTSLDLTSFILNDGVELQYMFYDTCNNNQGEAYQWLAASDEIANKLNDNATTGINTAKLVFMPKVAINATNFPDLTFRAFVSANYDKNKDGWLFGDELTVTTMDVSGKGIVNLKGIELFTSLTSLNCSNNVLTAVDLSKNTKLTTFNGTGQSVPMTLSYDSDSKKVYFDIAGAETGKLSVTGFTLTDNNGTPRATSNDMVTDRKMFDQADFTSDTGLGNNQLSGQFSLRTYALVFDSQYATVCLPWNATVPTGAKVYTVTVSDNTAQLSPYAGSVLAKETAFVVEGTDALLFTPSSAAATAPASNDLKGTTTNLTVAARSVLTLGRSDNGGELGFWRYTGTTVQAYSGYLDAPAGGAKGYVLRDGTPTSISTIVTEEPADTPWYTLRGVRLPKKPTQPGVYVHGKKKVIIK